MAISPNGCINIIRSSPEFSRVVNNHYKKNGINDLSGDYGEIDYSDWYGEENLILSWYTGVKDSNAKDIYEGDVISYTQALFNVPPERYPTKTKTVKYKPLEGKWNIFETNAGEFDIRVIGNIFENPELLNETH